MVLKVKQIIKELNGKITVRGESGIGAFMGTWMSRYITPETDKIYSCELSLPEIKGEEMKIKRFRDMPTYTDITLDDKVVFKGVCIAVEDGSMVVGFTNDWIECFEFGEVELHQYDTVTFLLDKEEILIYPYDEAQSE